MSTDQRQLQADVDRLLRRLNQLQPHLATLYSLGYEPANSGDDTHVATSDLRDVGDVGDGRVRDALEALDRHLLAAETAVMALGRRLALHETSGSDDPGLRGTTINQREWREVTRAQGRRRARGEGEERIVAQPTRPGGSA